MKKLIILSILAVFSADIAMSGETVGFISFTGAITEPACTADADRTSAAFTCVRAGVSKTGNYHANTVNNASPFNLAYITVMEKPGRRDVVIIYK